MKQLLFILTLALGASILSPQAAFSKNKKKEKKKKEETETFVEDENKAQYLFVKAEGHFLLKEFPKAIALYSEALHFSPNNEVIYYKIGESYYHLGLINKATESAQKALELNNTRKEYYLMLGDIYMNNKEFEASAEVYEKLLTNVKGTEEYYFELGEIYNELVKNEKTQKTVYSQNHHNKVDKELDESIEKHVAKAIEAYSKAEKHYGAHEEITFKKQRLYLGQNKVDEAIAEGYKLIEAFPEEMRYKLNLGELMYSNNHYQDAIDFMLKVYDNQKDDPSPLLMLVDFYNGMGNTEKADEYLQLAFSNPTMDVDSKVQLITNYLQYMNDDTKKATALKLASETVKTHPDKAQAHAIYADVLFLNDERVKAKAEYYEAVKIDPTKFLIWKQLIGLDLEQNQNDSLIKHSNEALLHFPESPIIWLYNGLGYQMTKNNTAALTSYETGREFAKGDPAIESQFNTQLGDTYNEVKEYQKSDQAYESALEYDPNNVQVLNNFSYFLSLRVDKLEEAKAMSERVVRMYPEEPTYLDTYAWVLYKMKDYQGAKKYLEKALKTSLDGTILEHYGDVLFQLGKTTEALEYWTKAKAQGGATTLIDKKIKDKKLYE